MFIFDFLKGISQIQRNWNLLVKTVKHMVQVGIMLPRVLFAGMVLVGRARAEYVKPAGWLSIDRERACQVVRQAGREVRQKQDL